MYGCTRSGIISFFNNKIKKLLDVLFLLIMLYSPVRPLCNSAAQMFSSLCVFQVQNSIATYATWTSIATLLNLTVVLDIESMSPTNAATVSLCLLLLEVIIWLALIQCQTLFWRVSLFLFFLHLDTDVVFVQVCCWELRDREARALRSDRLPRHHRGSQWNPEQTLWCSSSRQERRVFRWVSDVTSSSFIILIMTDFW